MLDLKGSWRYLAKCASRSPIGASNVKRGDLDCIKSSIDPLDQKELLALLYQQKEHMCLIRSEGRWPRTPETVMSCDTQKVLLALRQTVRVENMQPCGGCERI